MVDHRGVARLLLAGRTYRVLVTAAGQIGERVARAREEAQRRAQAASEQEARELASRLAAEQRAARAELGNVYRSQWWDNATAEQIGHAFQVARAWSQEDPEAVRAEARMRDELRTRYGVDVDATNADPAAVRAAVAHAAPEREASPAHVVAVHDVDQAKAWFAQHDPDRLRAWQSAHGSADTLGGMRDADRQLVEAWRAQTGRGGNDRDDADAERNRAQAENAEAVRLMQQADRDDARAEQAREAAEHEPDPEERVRAAAEAEQRETSAAGTREDGRTLYDSAERRSATASELEAKGIDREVVEARMHADVSQAKPAAEAVKDAPAAKGVKARRARGRGPQVQRTGLGR